jgi:hypothetical protein
VLKAPRELAPFPRQFRDCRDFVFESSKKSSLVGLNDASGHTFDCSPTRTTKNDKAGHSLTFGG